MIGKLAVGFAVCLALAAAARAQVIELPKEVSGRPGVFVVVTAKTDGTQVKWLSVDDGLNLIPPELLKSTLRAVVMAGAPGRYRLIAWTAKGDVPSEAAVCIVVIGEVPPDPKPMPPGPPKPPPDDEDKFDAGLLSQVRTAYAKETSAKKAQWLAYMAAMYKSAPKNEVKDQSLKTVADLVARLGAVRRQQVADNEFIQVRNAVALWLGTRLPADPAQALLDDDMRRRCAAAFRTVGATLRELGRVSRGEELE